MKIAFIGVGRMGSALLNGLLDKGMLDKDDAIVCDTDKAKLDTFPVYATHDASVAVRSSDVLFMCVKPKTVEAVLADIKTESKDKLLISIAAGISTKYIEDRVDSRVVRVMPNTPALVGEMAAAYALGSRATDDDAIFVDEILNGLGLAVRVDEKLMDAVTGLSGSGPAYVYYFIDSFARAGQEQGIPYELSLKLAAKTVKGAAEMILDGQGTPDELVEMVSSPGGTTIEGMNVLTSSELDSIVGRAVKAATEKSRKLTK